MLLENLTLGVLRRLSLNHVGEAGVARDVGILVNHRDIALSDSSNDKFVVNPDANHGVSHGETVATDSDCFDACLFACHEERYDDMCDDCYDEIVGGVA